MRLGHYELPNNVFVAPMAGVTDRPFRQLCKSLGAGHAISEMAASNPRLWASEKSSRRIDHAGEMEPKAVQIAGADPDELAECAKFNVDKGAQIIDINMGCPVKKVCNNWCGSALLQFEDLVERIQKGTWKMAGKGNNFLSLIHIDDLAAAYAKIAEKMPLGERLCLVDDSPMRQNEFLGLLAGELGCKPPASTDIESYRKLSGDLAAETMTASVRVTNEKMKRFLLPELKFPTCTTGLPDVIKRMEAMRTTEETELPKVSGF